MVSNYSNPYVDNKPVLVTLNDLRIWIFVRPNMHTVLRRFKIPLRVNVHSSVNSTKLENCGCSMHFVNTAPQTVLVVGGPPPVMRGILQMV